MEPAIANDDLALLTVLDEEEMLRHLENRYNDDDKKIYTRVGDILIAVNPFQYLDVYGLDVAAKYRQV
jgi:myosin heavy subunit